MIRLLTRCYRLALALYPRRVREIYAREQFAVFAELLEDARASGRAPALKIALCEWMDLPGNLFQAYLEDEMINHKTHNFLRWTARVISLLISAFILLFIIGEGIPEIIRGQADDLLPFLPWLGLAVAGTIIIWFREIAGAVLMIIGAVAMAIYIGEMDMFLVYSLPYLVAAILILAGIILSRRAGNNTVNRPHSP